MPFDADPFREARETTATYIRQILQANPDMQQGMSRADLVELGKRVWAHSYAKTQKDEDAFDSLAGAFQRSARIAADMGSDTHLMLASSFLYMPMEQILIFWSARWADQGFPVVQMGHKYAAALISTSINVEPEDIRAPFKAFFIDLPDGLLDILDPKTGKTHNVQYILVQQLRNNDGQDRWSFVASAGRIALWRHGFETDKMTEPEVLLHEGVDWTQYSFGLDVDDRDERTYLLIHRLILNTCVAMSSQDTPVKPLGKTNKFSAENLRSSPEPLVRVYQVGKPIQLDCRPAIQAYLRGERKRVLSVQTLVRGHWKRQPYGPKASLRKWIWREPFWRGPEEAPIITRPHKLEDGV